MDKIERATTGTVSTFAALALAFPTSATSTPPDRELSYSGSSDAHWCAAPESLHLHSESSSTSVAPNSGREQSINSPQEHGWLDDLNQILDLDPEWAGPGSPTFKPNEIARVAKLLLQLRTILEDVAVFAFPHPNGSIHVEVSLHGSEAELEFNLPLNQVHVQVYRDGGQDSPALAVDTSQPFPMEAIATALTANPHDQSQDA